MENKLTFRIFDRGITYRPTNERFTALAPYVSRSFRTRYEAEIWLLGCYKFLGDLHGYPLHPVPNFRLIDQIDVEVML